MKFKLLFIMLMISTLAFGAFKAKQYNFSFETGATFDPILAWEDESNHRVDLSGCSATMYIRPDYGLQPVITMNSTDAQHIFIQRDLIETSNVPSGSVTGSISLIVTPGETAVLELPQYVYSLDITFPTGQVWRLLYGNIFPIIGGNE